MDKSKEATAQNGLDPDLAKLLNIEVDEAAAEPSAPAGGDTGEPDFHTLFAEEKRPIQSEVVDTTRAKFPTIAKIQEDPIPYADWIHPDDREAFRARIRESATTLSACRWEGRTSDKVSDEQYWFQLASQPVRLADGSVVWDGILLDITEHKRIDEIERGMAAA